MGTPKVEALPRHHRRILSLYFRGKRGPEIAKAVGLTYGRVYQILREYDIHRAPRKAPKVRIKVRRDRVVDKIIRYLQEHPMSTVAEVAAGIGHENVATIRVILSRLKAQGEAVSDVRSHASEPFLWSRPDEEST
jgi:transposase